MIAALAYAPRGTALDRAGPLAASAYFLALAGAAFAVSNPIALAGVAAATACVGLLARARRALAGALRWGAALGFFVVLVNALTAQRGDTVLVRGGELPVVGTVDVTAEALAEGAVLALRITVVLAAFAVYSACVDPDRVLRLLRPLARRSALTATLIIRLVPLAAADYASVREAAALRGPGARPVGRAAMARRLVAGSLDRAVDVAATLELRGYGRGAPGRAGTRRRAPESAAFAAAALGLVAATVAGRASGAFDYESYPVVSLAASPATWALAGALPALAAAPLLAWRARHGALRPGRWPRG